MSADDLNTGDRERLARQQIELALLKALPVSTQVARAMLDGYRLAGAESDVLPMYISTVRQDLEAAQVAILEALGALRAAEALLGK